MQFKGMKTSYTIIQSESASCINILSLKMKNRIRVIKTSNFFKWMSSHLMLNICPLVLQTRVNTFFLSFSIFLLLKKEAVKNQLKSIFSPMPQEWIPNLVFPPCHFHCYSTANRKRNGGFTGRLLLKEIFGYLAKSYFIFFYWRMLPCQTQWNWWSKMEAMLSIPPLCKIFNT